MLIVVPYLVRRPGTELSEAARLFEVDQDDLVEDLNLLFVSGLPPYGPGDLIDVDIQDGRVWIEMADYFGRPLRLTRNEAAALYLRGTALAATPGLQEGTALATALEKLRRGLGEDTLGELAGRVEASGEDRGVQLVDALRAAARDHGQVEIEYHAISSGETTVRRIDPEEVFYAIGNWYVAAWDHLADDERLFRADRIRRVTATGEWFEPRGLSGAGRPLYSHTERDLSVRLRLSPEARWVSEYYEVDAANELEDGWLEVELRTSRLEWLATLVLRLSEDVQIQGPKELKDRVRDLAVRTRKRYG